MAQNVKNSDERTRERVSNRNRFSTLDEERLLSMADEGGCSGAMMEIDDVSERGLLQKSLSKSRFFTIPKVVAVLALAGIGLFVYGYRRSLH